MAVFRKWKRASQDWDPQLRNFLASCLQTLGKLVWRAAKLTAPVSPFAEEAKSSSGLLGQLESAGQGSEGLSSEKGLQQSEESSSDVRGHVLSQSCANHTQKPARKRLPESSELASGQLY